MKRIWLKRDYISGDGYPSIEFQIRYKEKYHELKRAGDSYEEITKELQKMFMQYQRSKYGPTVGELFEDFKGLLKRVWVKK